MSIILFAFGGWMLSGQVAMAWTDSGMGSGVALGATLFLTLFAIPFLLLGAWASPGARWAELGLTMLIVAGLMLVAGIFMAAMFLDPTAEEFMPPDMPDLSFNPVLGTLNLLVIGGTGYLLRRWDLKRRA